MSPRDPSYDLESPGLRWDLAYAWSAFVGLLRALWGRVRRRKDTCHDDYGNYPYYEDSEECPECGGEGWVDPHDPLWEGFDPVTCRKCRGTGYLDLPVGAPGGPKP